MMWLDYFGDKAHVYGADIETAVRVVAKDRPGRIQIFIGDQGDPSYLRRLCQEIGPGRIDFILDDASHVPWHQILGVEQLFPCLNPDGGVYMVSYVERRGDAVTMDTSCAATFASAASVATAVVSAVAAAAAAVVAVVVVVALALSSGPIRIF